MLYIPGAGAGGAAATMPATIRVETTAEIFMVKRLELFKENLLL